jgi:hypothetical protein
VTKPKANDAAAQPSEMQPSVTSDAWGPLETKFIQIDPRKLKRQALNARYMTAAQMDLLVQNVRVDGRLTSTPLCYQPPGADEDGIEILSGHHRTEAAIRAPLDEITIEVIVTELSHERKVQLQLAHNAVSGQDDATKLAQLYDSLDLNARKASGLTDDVLNAFKDITLGGLSVSLQYQEMNLFFLPEEAEVVKKAFARIDKAAKKQTAYIAAYADFQTFFDVAVRVKSKFDVFNSATALRMMVDLATQRLDQIEAEEAEDAANAEAARQSGGSGGAAGGPASAPAAPAEQPARPKKAA